MMLLMLLRHQLVQKRAVETSRFFSGYFETAGAVLMRVVTNTIRKGIADYKCFEDDADLLMYGCMDLFWL